MFFSGINPLPPGESKMVDDFEEPYGWQVLSESSVGLT